MLTVYKASAGSGKTYTLAYEYIKLLLGTRRSDGTGCYRLNIKGHGRPHARILAITFTNKATAEMKSRILKELHGLTEMPAPGQKDANYAAALMAEFSCTRQQLAQAASKALRALLNDYGAFNVSTIDAFFQSILRSFAHEIDRQGDYRLELNGEDALSQAMMLMLDEISRNPNVKENATILRWLADQSTERMYDGRDYNPFNRAGGMYKSIIAGAKSIFDETFAQSESAIKRYLDDPARPGERLDKWLAKEIDSLRQRERKAIEAAAALDVPLKKNVRGLIGKMHNAGCATVKNFESFHKGAGYISLIRQRKPEGAFLKADLKFATDSALDILSNWVETVADAFPRRQIYALIRKSLASLQAIGYISRFIEQYRRENNIILISDSNTLLNSIIKGSDTPFIYERAGMEFKNFLIDEFQDTSRMQWENLKPLVGTSIEEEDSLIIGDEKQSIYRFRGGDPELLAREVPFNHFPKYTTIKGQNHGENTNYRSAHDIVRFNNTLFRRLASQPGRNPVPGYEGVAQSLASATASLTSWIRITDLSKEAFAESARSLIADDKQILLEGEGMFNASGVAMYSTGQTIVEQLARGYRQKDIAILVSERKHGSVIADFLGTHFPQIRIISEEALLVSNSSAVKLIVSILELIDSSLDTSADPSALAAMENAVNRSPLFADDNQRKSIMTHYLARRRRAALVDNFEYLINRGMPFDEALEKAIDRANAINTDPALDVDSAADSPSADLADIRRDNPPNLSALIQAIIKHKVDPALRAKELSYIAAFVDFADEFMNDRFSSVHAFLAHWNESKNSLSVAPGEREDAVTITTIHKAKGLEWDCVHIPLLDWDYIEEPRSGWFTTENLSLPEGLEAPPILYFPSPSILGSECSPFLNQYNKNSEDLRVDNINVAYVAFTRAARELNVCITSLHEKTLGRAIVDIIAMPPDEREQNSELFVDMSPHLLRGTSLEFGSPTTKQSASKSDSPIVAAPTFEVSFSAMADSLTRLSDLTGIAGAASDSSDDVTDRPDEFVYTIVDRPENQAMEQAARRGIILHGILSRMVTLADLDKAIDSMSRKIDSAERAQFRDILSQAFAASNTHVDRWFSSDNVRVLNEQSIYSPMTGATTRADRIVWLPDGSVEIIDYKFTSAVHRAHYEQVRDYVTALENLGHRVRGYLWYPMSDKVIQVQ